MRMPEIAAGAKRYLLGKMHDTPMTAPVTPESGMTVKYKTRVAYLSDSNGDDFLVED